MTENEARFGGIFDNAAVGMGMHEVGGRWLDVNRKLCDVLGYTRAEIVAINAFDMVHADEQAMVADGHARLSRGELTEVSKRARLIRKGGGLMWAIVSSSLIAATQARPAHLLSIVQDISADRLAEQVALAAEQRLRAGLENLGEMIALTDANDRIVVANRRFVEFNHRVAEHTRPGCHYSDHLRAGIALGMFPQATGREDAWLAERMSMRHAGVGPVERQRQDGRWLMVDDQVLPDGGVVSYGIEITERKLAEQAARETNERLNLALEFSRVLLWDHDFASGRTFLSAGWAEVLGGKPGESVAQPGDLLRLAHADDLPRMAEHFRAVRKGERAEFALEHRLATPLGQWLWVLTRGRVAARDSAGRALRMIGTSVDVTERKAADAALVASEERIRSLVNLSNDVFWETDAEHRFASLNYGRISATSSPPAPEIGMTLWEVPHTSLDENTWRRHREDLAAHRIFRDFEVARPLPDGGEHVMQISGEPVFDVGGKFAGYRGVGKDISARRAAENALRALNADLERRVAERTVALETAYRELEAFSYSVSHDLRAPLRAIVGFSAILREDEGDRLSDDGRRLLAIIDDSARRMGNLTDALLALARTSRQKLAHGRVDMSAIANEVAGELARDYPGTWIEIHPLPPAAGDATLIRQIFANLIGNALKYSARATTPRVDVGAETDGDMPVYFVRDNGAGFDMAYAERLFKPFERLHAEKEFAGAGIGLALVHMIVQRHGGSIRAEGALGRGAVFRFSLESVVA